MAYKGVPKQDRPLADLLWTCIDAMEQAADSLGRAAEAAREYATTRWPLPTVDDLKGINITDGEDAADFVRRMRDDSRPAREGE